MLTTYKTNRTFVSLVINTSVNYPIYNHNNTNAKKTGNIQQKFELLPP